MITSQFLKKHSPVVWAVSLGLIFFFFFTYAEAGGGGGGGDPGSTFSISWGTLGVTTATPTSVPGVFSLSNNANFSQTGPYSSTATYSATLSAQCSCIGYVSQENSNFGGGSINDPTSPWNPFEPDPDPDPRDPNPDPWGRSGGITYACNADDDLAITITVESPQNSSIDINGEWYRQVGNASGGSAISITNSSSGGNVSSTLVFPSSDAYAVLATGQYGTGGTDNPISNFSYEANIGPVDCGPREDGDPYVDLKVRNNTTGSDWVDGPITINTSDDLDLTWDSDNVFSCGGSEFTVPSGIVNGTQTTVSNPAAGTSKIYTIICTSSYRTDSGSRVSVSDSVRVNALSGPGTGQPPTLTGDPIYVLKGGSTALTWNTNGNDPASCTLTGPGVNLSPVSGNTGTHTATVYGESTYTIQCPGGSDSVTIHVLPVILET